MKEFVEKLIERLEENIFVAELHGFGWDGQRVGNLLCLGDVKEIAEQLAEEHNNGWISVEDELPKTDGRYLCSYNYKDGGENYVQVLSYYANDEKPHFQHEGYQGLEVVAWQNLPAPYKKGE